METVVIKSRQRQWSASGTPRQADAKEEGMSGDTCSSIARKQQDTEPDATKDNEASDEDALSRYMRSLEAAEPPLATREAEILLAKNIMDCAIARIMSELERATRALHDSESAQSERAWARILLRKFNPRKLAEPERLAVHLTDTLLDGKSGYLLFKEAVEGDAQAFGYRHRLIEANLRLVVDMAKRESPNASRSAFSDMIQEGNLGLERAALGFDYRRGCRFSTYACWWIRKYIKLERADQKREIHTPDHILSARTKQSAVKRQLTRQLGREPTDDEVAATSGFSPEKRRQIELASVPIVSLDRVVFLEGDEVTRHALVPGDEDPFGVRVEREIIASVRQALNAATDLTDAERQVVQRHFGFNHPQGQNEALAMIAGDLKISKQRASQLKIRALGKLKPHLERRFGPEIADATFTDW